jgi:hypothetical protein
MPRKYLMSWDAAPNYRWVKMHKGRRHRITCGELGLPEIQWTQEASYLMANAWWQRTQADLEARPQYHPHANTLNTLQEYLGHAERHGLQSASKT